MTVKIPLITRRVGFIGKKKFVTIALDPEDEILIV